MTDQTNDWQVCCRLTLKNWLTDQPTNRPVCSRLTSTTWLTDQQTDWPIFCFLTSPDWLTDQHFDWPVFCLLTSTDWLTSQPTYLLLSEVTDWLIIGCTINSWIIIMKDWLTNLWWTANLIDRPTNVWQAWLTI